MHIRALLYFKSAEMRFFECCSTRPTLNHLRGSRSRFTLSQMCLMQCGKLHWCVQYAPDCVFDCQGVMQDVQILVMAQGYITQCPDLNRSTSYSFIRSSSLIIFLLKDEWSRVCSPACPTCNDFHGLVQKIMELQDILAKTSSKVKICYSVRCTYFHFYSLDGWNRADFHEHLGCICDMNLKTCFAVVVLW